MRKRGGMNEIQTTNTIQQWFEGRKTYLTCLVVGVLLFGSWQGWWRMPAEVYAGLAALATAFLRAGLSREVDDLRAQGGGLGPDGAGPAAPPNPPGPAVGAKAVVPALLLAAGLGLAGLTGCGTLDPAGVYHGDKVLYAADQTLGDAYTALHRFVQWEYDNRAALASQPAIRQAADQVRAQSPQWFAAALALRDAYAASSTAADADALATALAVIQAAVTQAAAWEAGAAPPPTSNP